MNMRALKRRHFLVFMLLLLIHGMVLFASQRGYVFSDQHSYRKAGDSIHRETEEKARGIVRQKVLALLKGNDCKNEVELYATSLEIASLGEYAVEPLLETLHKNDKTARASAAEALGEIGDKRAVKPLIKALGDKSSLVRKKSAEALGLLGDRRAVEALIRAIIDKDQNVSYHAEVSLGKLGDRRAIPSLIRALKDKERMYGAVKALKEIDDPQATKPILELLASGDIDPFTKCELHELITKTGKPAVNYLLEAMRSNNNEKKKCAVYTLYYLQVPDAVDPLIAMLGSDDFDCWLSAIYVLGSYENSAAHEKLLALLRSAEGRKKLGAACALGLMKDERATPYILESIESFDFCVGYSPRVEQVALTAIGEPAVPQLLTALNSGKKETRIIVLETLAKCDYSKEIERHLIDSLKDKDDSVKFYAALALEDCASPDATIPLIEAMKDGDDFVHHAATRALGRTGDPRALKVLMKFLEDPRKDEREYAMRALGELKDRRAIEPLSKLLESDDMNVYSTAAWALGEIGDTAFVTRLIEKILGQKWNDEKTGRDIRRDSIDRLAHALMKAGRPSIGQITTLMKVDAWQAHYIAGKALGEIDDPGARVELMRAFSERRLDVIAGAHEFFIRRGIPGSEPILAQALNEYSDFYMTGAFSNCGSRKMKKIALLDTMNKNYCGWCMRGAWAGRWEENVNDRATLEVKLFIDAIDSLSSPE